MLKANTDKDLIRMKKKRIEFHLKSMANNIIQIRIKPNQTRPLLGSENDYFGLYKIDSKSYYFNYGVDLKNGEFIL